MIKNAIYLSLIFFPFQVLDIHISQTTFGLSSIILGASIPTFFLFLKNKLNFNLIFLILFIVIQLVIFIVSPAPVSRFISGLFWIFLFLIMIYCNQEIKFDHLIAEKIIIIVLFISAIYAWYQYFYVITPELYTLGVKLRPGAFFSEPSYAGLAFYAASLASLFKFIFYKKEFKYFFLFIIFFATGILTLSMHLVTFLLTFIAVIYFRYFKFNLKFLYKVIFYLLILTLIISLSLYLLNILNNEFYLVSTRHFLRRINIFDWQQSNSLSLLAWIRGFDQMVYSIKTTYIFGFGLGSTGEYYFPSLSGDRMNAFGLYYLTLKDAFSLFFRLVIEIGIVFTGIFLYYLHSKSYLLFKQINEDKKKMEKLIFIFIFFIYYNCWFFNQRTKLCKINNMYSYIIIFDTTNYLKTK